VIFVDLRIYFY